MHIDEKQTSQSIEQELGAAFIASGIGSTVLGIVTTLAEISAPLRDSLFWFNRGGPLGGKTSLAVLSLMVSWVLLTVILKKRPMRLRSSFILALVLVSIGLLLTFPPIFRLIAQQFGA
jgi:hypothetical protein